MRKYFFHKYLLISNLGFWHDILFKEVDNKKLLFAMKKALTLSLLALLGFASCKKDNNGGYTEEMIQSSGEQLLIDKLDETTKFSFNQHETWSGTINVQGYEGALANIPVQLMNGEEVLETGWTNDNGNWKLTLNHTPSMDLKVVCNIPTLQGSYPIVSDDFMIQVSPAHSQAAGLEPLNTTSNKSRQTTTDYRGKTRWYDDRLYTYQRSRGYQTLPIMETADTLSDTFLTSIANSVPEEFPVGRNNPSLLADGNTSLFMADSGDVYLTFVDEGAGYRNVVGIFTYTANNEPTSVSDIDTIWTVFENFSKLYSGGGLVAGDRVYIGSYPQGTYIGFALIANGYNGNGRNYRNNNTYYSLPDLNPETTAEKRKHNIVLYDETTMRFVIGFEDLHRQVNSDEDFNDALFYCTATPPDAIDTSDVTPIIPEPEDCDNDGVPDIADVAPCDDRYATTYTTSGKLFYEDLYPYLGDYDFNDVVINYTAVAWKNANGVTNKMDYTFELLADGGTLTNGFGLAIDGLSGSAVSNVTFGDNNGSLETLEGAVMILTDDMSFDGFGFMNNELNGNRTTTYPTYSVSFEINGASASDVFWGDEMDPFIFQNLDNGKRNEVHLKYKKPTSEADTDLIGTGDDITLLNDVTFDGTMWQTGTPAERYWAELLHTGTTTVLPATSITYTDLNGYPWAMHMDANVKHATEKTDFSEAYLQFSGWITSGGRTNTNWFASPVTGKVFE